jgi:hypothetical protein
MLFFLLCAAMAQQSRTSAADDLRAGVVLDLAGRGAEARKYFASAIHAAAQPAAKLDAERAMAISYAFDGDCRGAEKYDRAAYDFLIDARDFASAGAVADELGRICLDSGALDLTMPGSRRRISPMPARTSGTFDGRTPAPALPPVAARQMRQPGTWRQPNPFWTSVRIRIRKFTCRI